MYNSKIKSKQTDGLFEAILQLKDLEECYRFFDDICTVKEIQAISQRLEVVKLLVENKTYHEIEDETGASTATISRINRSLNYGSDGYKLVLERLGIDFSKKKPN
ncbi:TrpR-related protein YerC/YecD [Peptoniphilus koenoeneniae]|uniref:TrpR-related protein YerC/YecD n=1 Tax=Peptoniphilus koenoeneniae TaxID=507751 RepID=A0ABU0ASI4_9FIRM|nr:MULTISPECIES: YerC/YecD family TrpR-related protein [Peptoniphilus]ERT56907.1 TrpR family protein YerC/YecD [Peptoniphilus sp. BV3C26]MDQ0274229.1 TrpR-related protein YerC/YecD [Peptoniphilus koenoeneniae]